MESSDFTSRADSAAANEGMGTNIGSNGSSSISGSSGTASIEQNTGLADKASGALGSAKEKFADVGSSVRERASTAKDSLADALESGAEKLRQRTVDSGLAGATAAGGSTAIADDRIAQVTTKVAGGMDATAGWLRDADLDSLKASVETQVKEHPGRTLLIAVGLGYLLGKALKK
jgi:ElaB/YqjD/DUF883 family membrane-anchored ribosome-binding protein